MDRKYTRGRTKRPEDVREWPRGLLLEHPATIRRRFRKRLRRGGEEPVMRLISLAMVLLSCCPAFAAEMVATPPGSADTLEPWASKARPSDVARRHVEDIAIGEHKY